jgi:hypothetical protein
MDNRHPDDKLVEVSFTYQASNGEITRHRLNGKDAETWARQASLEELMALKWETDKIVWYGVK